MVMWGGVCGRGGEGGCGGKEEGIDGLLAPYLLLPTTFVGNVGPELF